MRFFSIILIILSILVVHCIADTTYVAAGNVSGIWTAENSPYVVNQGDLIVPNGNILEITPGVQVLMGIGRKLEVQGLLNAIGAEGDSVVFTCLNGQGYFWKHIYFNYPDDTCRMEYCVLERSNATGNSDTTTGGSVKLINGNMVLSHCSIRINRTYYFGAGVYAEQSNCSFDSCIFYYNWNLNGEGGALNFFLCTAIVTNCDFFYNSGMSNGGAVVHIGGNLSVNNCAFLQNYATSGGAFAINGAVFSIKNSTFFQNGISSAGAMYVSLSQMVVDNCIFSNNPGDEAIVLDIPGETSITYSCFYGNQANIGWYNLPGFQHINYVNSNGDSCDIYHNIFLPPQMVAPSSYNYNLLPTSPCIDAGDPHLPFDPDSTVSDIGKAFFDQTLYPIENLTITLQDENVHLNWPGNLLATQYCVYKSFEPYFELSAAQQFFTADTFFVDSDALSEGAGFYRVTVIRE